MMPALVLVVLTCIVVHILPPARSFRAATKAHPQFSLAPIGVENTCSETSVHKYRPGQGEKNKCGELGSISCGGFTAFCEASSPPRLCCCRPERVRPGLFGTFKKATKSCTGDDFCPPGWWPLLDGSPDLCAPEHSDKPYYLGSGAFGRVVQAKQLIWKGATRKASEKPSRMEDIAVKLVQGKLEHVQEAATECDLIRQFKSKHKTVLQTFACGESMIRGERAYVFFMEKARGGSLFDKVVPNGLHTRLNLALLKDYMRQMAHAVGHVHSEYNIAHRDIKMENFMLADDDGKVVKLIDFGLAVKLSTRRQVECAGTPPYVAPEDHYKVVIRRKETCEPSTAADVWSLGITFFIMHFGRYPCLHSSSEEMLACF
eukprot:TRINITY_DN21544_c0_g1_i2.p1 TRINITY_DN21544_c0_g1~~TRINITY_DN21544_c0_g1_i2.p1  ORF type:complete len:373 (-),score=39.79 TRINITY_DN21544_c0_g1_i2:373-1491(-)